MDLRRIRLDEKKVSPMGLQLCVMFFTEQSWDEKAMGRENRLVAVRG